MGQTALAGDMQQETIWFDSHAHLQEETYRSDLPLVLVRAFTQGVRHILLPASSFADAQAAVALAATDPLFVCAVGCHPHEAASFDQTPVAAWQTLVAQNRSRLVAVGEIGLDYYYDHSPRDVQKAVFRTQLEWARQWELPVIIHNREATKDCLDLLTQAAEDGLLLPDPGVFHCFSGSVETARRVLDLGFYLGFDGPVTFKNARRVRAVVAMVPDDRLLIETDSPFLTPEPHRGKRNEPAYLPLIGAHIAQIRQSTPQAIARLTTQNAKRLFRMAR